MSIDYNLQPYDKNGDTTGGRTLEFYKTNIIPKLNEYLVDGFDNGLDLGCGNGRFNKLIHHNFKKLTCIDPMEDIDEKFMYDNVEFYRLHLHQMADKKLPKFFTNFDAVIMVGSMHSIWLRYGEETLQHLDIITKSGSKLFIISDSKDTRDYTINGYFKLLETFITDDKKTKLQILEK